MIKTVQRLYAMEATTSSFCVVAARIRYILTSLGCWVELECKRPINHAASQGQRRWWMENIQQGDQADQEWLATCNPVQCAVAMTFGRNGAKSFNSPGASSLLVLGQLQSIPCVLSGWVIGHYTHRPAGKVYLVTSPTTISWLYQVRQT